MSEMNQTISQIEDNATAASDAVGKLVKKVEELSGALEKVKSSNLKGFSKTVDQLESIMQSISNIGVEDINLDLINNVYSSFHKLKKILESNKKIMDAVKDSFWALQTGFSDGNFGTGIILALDNLKGKMTEVQKESLGKWAITEEFTVVKDAVYDIITGTDYLVISIGKIGGAAAIAEAALYASFGPAGLVVGAITGLVGAFVGVKSAMNDLVDEGVGRAIRDMLMIPGGVSVSELTSGLVSAFGEAASGFDVFNSKSQELTSVQGNIRNVWLEIQEIQTAMDNGVLSVEDGKNRLNELFGELALLTSDKFSAINTSILSLYGEGSVFAQYVDQVGGDANRYIDVMISVNYRNAERARELTRLIQETEYGTEEYFNYVRELASLSIETDEATNALQNFAYDIRQLEGQIDWEELITPDNKLDTGKLTAILLEARTAYEDYEQVLEQVERETTIYWQGILDSATATEEERLAASDALNYLPEAIAQMKEDAWLQVMELTDMLQEGLVNTIPGVVEQAQIDWELGGTGAWYSSDEQVYDYLMGYNANVVEPLAAGIEEAFSDMKIDPDISWVDDILEQVYDDLFLKYDDGMLTVTAVLDPDYEATLRRAVIGGKHYVKGYSQGIYENAGEAYDSAYDMTMRAVVAMKIAQDSNSPSRVTWQLGNDAVDGYSLGIEENTESAANVMTGLIGSVMQTFAGVDSEFSGIGNQVMSGFLNGMAGMETALCEKAKSVADNVANSMKKTLDIKSPSRVMFSIGGFAMQGFQNGIESLYVPILSSMNKFGSDLRLTTATGASRIYQDYQNPYVDTGYPSYGSVINYDNSYVQNNSETNYLLRELLAAFEKGQKIVVNGRELGRTVRDEASDYFHRTGRSYFNY